MVLRAFSAGESVCAKVLISRKPRGIRGAFFVLSIFVLSVRAPAIAAGAFVVSGLRGFPRGFLCFQPLGYTEGAGAAGLGVSGLRDISGADLCWLEHSPHYSSRWVKRRANSPAE